MKPTRSLLFPVALALITCALPAVPEENRRPAADIGQSDARRAAIVAYCQKSRGKKVGNGECWTLANEAFKATGAARPAGQLRVWGRRLDLRREAPLPGDILECDRTRFADGTRVPTQHTAVITAVHSKSFVRIAEQNFGGKKKVRERDIELGGIRSGSIAVYRPQ